MSVQVTSEEIGPHKGWRRQQFMVGEQLYELFTVDREDEKRSSIRKVVDAYRQFTNHVIGIQSIITPDDAHAIIIKLNSIEAAAIKRGRNEIRQEFKSLLNIN